MRSKIEQLLSDVVELAALEAFLKRSPFHVKGLHDLALSPKAIDAIRSVLEEEFDDRKRAIARAQDQL